MSDATEAKKENAERRLILVTNDDGYQAPGIRALVHELKSLGDIVVVAPEAERSGAGHSLSLYQPLRLDHREQYENVTIYSCNGTPTDCVTLAIHFLLKRKPDMLASGINAGGNLGDDITYSGTVMAAMEGASQGIPSMAVSLVTSKFQGDYTLSARFALEFARRHLLGFQDPEEVFFSINVPALPLEEIAGVMITDQGRSIYHQKIEERKDPWGRSYYWVSGLRAMGPEVPGSDFFALENKKISVTPLKLPMSNMTYARSMENWSIFQDDFFRKEILTKAKKKSK